MEDSTVLSSERKRKEKEKQDALEVRSKILELSLRVFNNKKKAMSILSEKNQKIQIELKELYS